MAKKNIETILYNVHIAIRELLDKCWEFGGNSVGEKEFNAYQFIRNARSVLEDIETWQSRRIADKECRQALETTFEQYLRDEEKDWIAGGKKKLHIYHYLKELQQAHKILQAVKEDS